MRRGGGPEGGRQCVEGNAPAVQPPLEPALEATPRGAFPAVHRQAAFLALPLLRSAPPRAAAPRAPLQGAPARLPTAPQGLRAPVRPGLQGRRTGGALCPPGCLKGAGVVAAGVPVLPLAEAWHWDRHAGSSGRRLGLRHFGDSWTGLGRARHLGPACLVPICDCNAADQSLCHCVRACLSLS